MRPWVRCVRISQMPPPRDLHTGIPTGHPNSTVLISSPMSFAILGWQAFQPFPERFSARFRAEENRRDSLTVRPLRWRQCGFGCGRRVPLRCHILSVPHMVQTRLLIPNFRQSIQHGKNTRACPFNRGNRAITPRHSPLAKSKPTTSSRATQ
jgi:hypothetical protein